MRRRLLIATLIGLFTYIIQIPNNAQAYTPGSKQFINADNTFNVYVKAGEKISASFLRFDFQEPLDTVRGDVTVTIEGPDVKSETCVLAKDVPVDQGCTFSPRQAPVTGVWQVKFQVPDGSSTFEEVSPDVRWTKNMFRWSISVTGNEGEERGRIWTERYALRQPPYAQYIDDYTHYYVSEDGYIYRAFTRGYNGQISILSADSIGIRKGKECTSAYRSSEVSNSEYSPALGSCGNRFKLFFEEPAGDLPVKAKRWDGKEDWIRPEISRPTISDLSFKPDNSNDQLSGYISFNLRNFIGQYQIKVDVDNDGSFDGQNDVTMNQQMKKLNSGIQRIRFSGSDRQGLIISPASIIGVKVLITKVAEIHFVAADVEGRTGGLELVLVNGANAPSTELCWNDTDLLPLASGLTTALLDGRSCLDSTGGVHGWPFDNESWGNKRYIDDWVYASAKLVGANQITYPNANSINESTYRMKQNTVVIAIISTISALILIFVIFMFKKRKTSKSLVNKTPDSSGQQPSAYDNSIKREEDNDRW